MMTDNSAHTPRLYLVVALVSAVLALLTFAPTLAFGLAGGDLALTGIPAFAHAHGLRPAQAISAATGQLESEQGGWFPLNSIIVAAFWSLAPSVILARAVQLILVVANIATFSYCIARIARSWRLGLASAVATLAAIQLRKPHDPILTGILQLPLTLEFALLALASALQFNDTGSRRAFGVAAMFAAAACASDALGIALMLAIAVIFIPRDTRRAPLLLFPALALFFTAMRWLLHLPLSRAINWWASGSLAAHSTYAINELIAALPLTYRAFGNVVHDGITAYGYDSRFEAIPAIDALGGVAVVLATATLFLALSTSRKRESNRLYHCGALVSFGVLFWLISAVLRSPGTWTSGLPLGEADAYVYPAAYGVGLLLATGALQLAKVRGLMAAAPAATALAAFGILYGNVRVDAHVIALGRDQYELVNLLHAAANAPLAAALGKHDVLTIDGDSPFAAPDAPGFRASRYAIASALGRSFAVIPLRAVLPGGTQCANRSGKRDCVSSPYRARVWIIRHERNGPLRGGLTLAHWSRTDGGRFRVDRAVGYRQFPNRKWLSEVRAGFGGSHRGLREERTEASGTTLVVDVRRGCGPVDLGTVYAPAHPSVAFGPGFIEPSVYKRWNFAGAALLPATGKLDQNWRYGRESVRLEVDRDPCAPAALHVRAALYSAAPGLAFVSAPGIQRTLPISQAGVLLDIVVPASPSRHIGIDVTMDAPAAVEELSYPRFSTDRPVTVRLLAVAPTVEPMPRDGI